MTNKPGRTSQRTKKKKKPSRTNWFWNEHVQVTKVVCVSLRQWNVKAVNILSVKIKALKTLVWHLSRKPMKEMNSLKK